MEITELLKVIAWTLLGVTVMAGCFVSLLLINSGRAARFDRERNEAYDESAS